MIAEQFKAAPAAASDARAAFDRLFAEYQAALIEEGRLSDIAGRTLSGVPEYGAVWKASYDATERLRLLGLQLMAFPAPDIPAALEKMRAGLKQDPDGEASGDSGSPVWEAVAWMKAALADLERLASEGEP